MRKGKLVFGQKPNGPQLLGLVGLIVFWLASGRLEHIAGLVAYGAWFTWAWLEVTQGINYFRRAAGGSVFIVLLLIAVFG